MAVDWTIAPKGADRLLQDEHQLYWGNVKGEWFDTNDMSWNKSFKDHIIVAVSPKAKTVKDVYLAHPNGWDDIPNNYDDRFSTYDVEMILWDKTNHHFHKGGSGFNKEMFYKVCTRTDLEAYAGLQKSETRRISLDQPSADKTKQDNKWTHITPLGDKCYIKDNEQDREGVVLVVVKDIGYDLMKPDQLKPIKPPMTEEERAIVAEFVAYVHKAGNINLSAVFGQFCDDYEIT